VSPLGWWPAALQHWRRADPRAG